MNPDFLSSACSSGGCSSCSSCGPAAPNDTGTRELGKVTALLADLGLEVTYAYDDLVFVQHSAFLLQFTDSANTLKLFINTECDPKQANETAIAIILAFDKAGLVANPSGRYTLAQNDDNTLRLEFT